MVVGLGFRGPGFRVEGCFGVKRRRRDFDFSRAQGFGF